MAGYAENEWSSFLKPGARVMVANGERVLGSATTNSRFGYCEAVTKEGGSSGVVRSVTKTETEHEVVIDSFVVKYDGTDFNVRHEGVSVAYFRSGED